VAVPPPVEEDHHEHAEPEHVEIPATVRRNLGITFAKVESRRVAQTLRVPGAFELAPLARHEYRMALPGRVQLLVDQFDPVVPGTLLYRYQSPAWPELLHEILLGEQAMATAEAEIRVVRTRQEEARAKLELTRARVAALAESEFKRADLEAEAVALEASLPRLEAELERARTQLANAERTRRHALHRASTASGISEAELEAELPAEHEGQAPLPRYLTIDWIEVRATESGVVEALAVTDGAFVEPPAAVLSTVDPTLLRFRGHALQADLARITSSMKASVSSPLAPGTSVETRVPTRLTIGLEAHPEERTFTLFATPDERAPWIRPGLAAFLEVVVEGTQGPALAVPRSAVVQDGLTHVVFRRDPSHPDEALRVEPELGVSDGWWIELRSGVELGDEVVLSGAYELQLASRQRGEAEPGGHVHADGSVHDDH